MDIRDIKGVVEISDYSFYYFVFFVILALTLLIVIIFNLYKKFSNKNPKEFYLSELKNIDFKNPKESAYKITKYAKLLVFNEKSNDIYEELIQSLAIYKYKKDVPEITSETKERLNLFIEVVNGNI